MFYITMFYVGKKHVGSSYFLEIPNVGCVVFGDFGVKKTACARAIYPVKVTSNSWPWMRG